MGEGIADLISLSTLTAVEVTEARQVLERGIVPLVCERASEDDIAELYEICDRSDDALEGDDYPLELSAQWHGRFAQAAHNRAVTMLVESLHGPLVMSLERAREAAPLHGRLGVAEHRALVGAVAGRDSRRAGQVMTTHLERTAQRLAEADRGSRP